MARPQRIGGIRERGDMGAVQRLGARFDHRCKPAQVGPREEKGDRRVEILERGRMGLGGFLYLKIIEIR